MIEEPKNWMNQWPPAVLRREIKGDQTYALRFWGMALRLLWDVKGAMGANNLKQNWGTRVFDDGTIIKARSVFGMDSIEIDASNSIIGLGCKCSITLINVPDIVQPMRFPEIIGMGQHVDGRGFVPVEVEGTDFIKTYYTLELNCPGSDPLDWNVCDTGESAVEIDFKVEGTICKPFEYSLPEEPYYMGNPNSIVPSPPIPTEHCVYSLWRRCGGEILQHGKDSGGNYILWKAYTEWSDFGWQIVTFSRTGLGYMKLKAFIKDKSGKEACSSEAIVKVDCCHKDKSIRNLQLYWESFDSWVPSCVNVPFIYYGDSKWCLVPDITSMSYLENLFITHYVGFWAFPEMEGNCIPIDWKLDGPGKLMIWDDTSAAEWSPPAGPGGGPDIRMIDCHQGAIITATDRCGTQDEVRVRSCCEANPEITLLYTSLSMGCGANQDITAVGGCHPCTWTLDGGGYLTGDLTSQYVNYHAPAVNVNCADHPVLTVTDCCGKTTSLSFIVACTVDGVALVNQINEFCGECWWDIANSTCFAYCNFKCWKYDCSGTFLGFTESNPGCAAYQTMGTQEMPGGPSSEHCNDVCSGGGGPGGVTNRWGENGWCGVPGFGLIDVRSEAMKLQGCCPINPFTGLPY